jgi:N-acetylglutamate synthase
MRYRLELRLTEADIGERVVLRWRRPAKGGGEEVADVLGMLEAADAVSFTVRKASGEVVVIPRERALGGKTVPPAPAVRRGRRKKLSTLLPRVLPGRDRRGR